MRTGSFLKNHFHLFLEDSVKKNAGYYALGLRTFFFILFHNQQLIEHLLNARHWLLSGQNGHGLCPMDLIDCDNRDWHGSNIYMDKYIMPNPEKRWKGNYRKLWALSGLGGDSQHFLEEGDISVELDLWVKCANEAKGIGVVVGILAGHGLALEPEEE